MDSLGQKRNISGYEEIYVIIDNGKEKYKAWIPTSGKVRVKKRKVTLPDGFDLAHGN